jgi:thiamine biosynthesis protein ThiS
MTVRRVLEACRYSFPLIVVKVDGVLVQRDEYDTRLVKDGSEVQAIHLISGG